MSWLAKWLHKRKERQRFRSSTRSEVFQYIYETNKWGAPNSRSGKGSELERTVAIRAELPALLARLEVESILDIPCGDLHWISTLDLSNYRYTGADIVPEIIEANRQRYPEHTFCVLDICSDPLPAADLILTRDLLVHLSFVDIARACKAIGAANARYLACTTFPDLDKNEDKITGNHRRLNMCIAPFNWPKPPELLADGAAEDERGKYLGVWPLDELAPRLSR